MAPVLDEVAAELGDTIKMGKVDVDQERNLANLFGVKTIPTVAVMRDGRMTGLSVGIRSKERILELMEE